MMRMVSMVVSLLSKQEEEHEPCRSLNHADMRKRLARAVPVVVAIVSAVGIAASFEPEEFRS
jgi:hypothetical protein